MTTISLIAYGFVSVAVLLFTIHRVRRERRFRWGIYEREKRHAEQRAREARGHQYHLASP